MLLIALMAVMFSIRTHGESISSSVPIHLSVDFDGVPSVLSASSEESAESAARNWVISHGLGGKPDLDNILRQLVILLRTAGVRSDADSLSGFDSVGAVVTPWRGVAVASVVIHVPFPDGTRGPPHTLSVMEGETPRAAAEGFLLRMGLSLDSASYLENELIVQIAALALTPVTSTTTTTLPLPVNDDDFEAPLPATIGVSLNVTFDRSANSSLPGPLRQTIHVRFGEDAVAAADIFLKNAGILDSAQRQVGRKAIVDKLFKTVAVNADAAAVAKAKAETGAEKNAAMPSSYDDDDVTTTTFLDIPLVVSAAGDSPVSFNVAIQIGTSLRGAARVFCVKHWDALKVPLSLAADKLHNESESRSDSMQEPTVDVDTCASIIFGIFNDYAKSL